jgi:hypothetical protein
MYYHSPLYKPWHIKYYKDKTGNGVPVVRRPGVNINLTIQKNLERLKVGT